MFAFQAIDLQFCYPIRPQASAKINEYPTLIRVFIHTNCLQSDEMYHLRVGQEHTSF
jgi:hypothetical protein